MPDDRLAIAEIQLWEARCQATAALADVARYRAERDAAVIERDRAIRDRDTLKQRLDQLTDQLAAARAALDGHSGVAIGVHP